MTSMNLYRSMSGIDPKFILEAAPTEETAKRKAPGWTKWAAAAACLCVVLVGAGLFYAADRSSPGEEDIAGCYAETVTYNGTEYEVCRADNLETLERCGLPTELTKELAGECLGSLELVDEATGWQLTEEATGDAIYEYAPQPNENVYILLLDGEYCAAIRFDADGYHGLNE